MYSQKEDPAMSVGQYEMVSRDATRTCRGRNLRIVLYGAYNALGLIGPEMNGIAILDEDARRVILDGHLQEDTGYFGPTRRQVVEHSRIMGMDEDLLEEFIAEHPRTR
jgi:hypothetical protein